VHKYVITDFEKYEPISRKFGREPVISLMPDGSLVCIMLTGGPTEPHNDNFVVICRSTDGGKTWTPPEKLFAHKSRGVWATEIYTGYSHPMIVVHTYAGDCPYKELQTFVSYTYDNGKTWTSPKMIAPHANGMCIRKGIRMSNGETLFPVYHTSLDYGFEEFPEFETPGFWKGTHHRCAVVVSSDEGRSYAPYGDFENIRPENYDGTISLWEPNCVETENGHIVLYMRDSLNPYINCAESYDYGRTWKHTGNIDIPNANSKITMQKIGSKILLISNVNDSCAWEGRTKLQIQISSDGCKTWRFVCFLGDEDEHIYYPHCTADEENRLLYVAYENSVQHYLNVYTFDEIGI